MALHVDNTDNVTDAPGLPLAILRAHGVTTAIVGGTIYLFVTGEFDSGVSVFSVAVDGTLTNVDNVTDDATLHLGGAAGVTTAVVSGNTYLFVSGVADDGVSVFSVAVDGTLTNVDNVGDDATVQLFDSFGLATAVVGGATYLFVTGNADSGVSVFSVAADGTLTNVDNVTDDATLELGGAVGVTTAVVGGTTYLFVAGIGDDGVSVFSVAADGTLTNADNVTDGGPRQLNGAFAVTATVVGGITYLFVTGNADSGVSVFSVAADGTLINVDNVTDDATLELAGARGVATAVVAGTTYLLVAGHDDNGVSVFSVAADGTLINVANVSDDAALQLQAANSVATAVIGGTPHMFVAGQNDSGVSAFSLDGNVPLLGDVLWRHSDGTVATAGQEFPAVPHTFQIRGIGDFDADGDADILWRHVDGLVVTWEMENGDFLTNHNLPQASLSFQIAGTGDFDGDGDDDILWRGNEGQVVTWEMEDGTFVTNHNLPAASTSFQVAGTGDFDSDGDDDILWRGNEGQVVTWEMEDGAFVTNHNLPAASTSFQVAGTGDFDSDGDDDILWRHDEGQVVTWEMEDGALVTNHNLPQVSTSFRISGTEDFDSDGDDDILWRHDEGLVVTWEMEDGALLQTQNFGVVSNGWQIRGTGEFDTV
jgi:6-phosphogluconolactonase (cycloisomerase 2 family)